MYTTKNNGYTFQAFMPIKESDMHMYMPIAGSFAVVKSKGTILLCYNTYREQWELPAGKREVGETPEECARRELFEETGQYVGDLEFQGLAKVSSTVGDRVKFNPVYSATIEKLEPFIENEETSKIVLWDGRESIGDIDEVDLKIIDFI